MQSSNEIISDRMVYVAFAIWGKTQYTNRTRATAIVQKHKVEIVKSSQVILIGTEFNGY